MSENGIAVVLYFFKFIYSFIILFICAFLYGKTAIIPVGLLELTVIIIFYSYLTGKLPRAGRWIGSAILLLFNFEWSVYYFGGSFVTLMMAKSLFTAQDISANNVNYFTAIALMVIVFFIPARHLRIPFAKKILPIALALELVVCIGIGTTQYSVADGIFGFFSQIGSIMRISSFTAPGLQNAGTGTPDIPELNDPEDLFPGTNSDKTTSETSTDSESGAVNSDGTDEEPLPEDTPEEAPEPEDTEEEPEEEIEEDYEVEVNEYSALFYKEEVADYREKPDDLVKKPNIILIFTEGLSQEIVEDERGIMPNVAAMEEISLNFTNYFNHTFATYRGIIGQLYSGYQLEDLDTNSLVSIQGLLLKKGYNTVMINTEPNNADFTSYLEALGFDTLISDKFSDNALKSLSDKDAYEVLFDTAEEYESSFDDPFFLCIYTFGTHTTLDSEDLLFGDGNNEVLNRFYNVDYWFGEFMEKFNESDLAEDTVIVFTADHATYTDNMYRLALPNSTRTSPSCDIIPFFIYYKGIEAETVDAKYRNTLDMVPTVLDYLDISGKNFFLGDSLFNDKSDNFFDTKYYDLVMVDTSAGYPNSLSDAAKSEFEEMLSYYFAASRSG